VLNKIQSLGVFKEAKSFVKCVIDV